MPLLANPCQKAPTEYASAVSIEYAIYMRAMLDNTETLGSKAGVPYRGYDHEIVICLESPKSHSRDPSIRPKDDEAQTNTQQGERLSRKAIHLGETDGRVTPRAEREERSSLSTWGKEEAA